MALTSRPKASLALDPRAAFIVTDILSDPLARARTFGTDSVLSTRFWTAVKTGTSKDMRDNWAIGYSQAYTVGVWMGNASGAPMWDVSGTMGAAPIWATVMNFLHKTEPSQPPLPPKGLAKVTVKFDSTLATAGEAARNEWFIEGTQQSSFAKIAESTDQPAANSKGRITAPVSGTIIALDPDIPPTRQRVSLIAQGTNLHWLIDGKPLAKGRSADWLPWPGRHVIKLVNDRGELQDEIRLEVRGAGVRK